MRTMRAIARSQRRFSTAPEIKRVGVVGLGLMGHGIAQTAAEKGFEVVAIESEARFLDAGMARIESSVKKLSEKAVKKGKMSEADAAVHVATTLSRALRTGILSLRCACVCVCVCVCVCAVLTAGSAAPQASAPRSTAAALPAATSWSRRSSRTSPSRSHCTKTSAGLGPRRNPNFNPL